MSLHDLFHNFIDINMPVVYFMYGLVFFVSGVAITVQYRKSDSFSFGQDLWLLGLFGILHGVSEWGYLFIPLQNAYLGVNVIFVLYALRTLLGAISFLVLFIFGVRMLFVRTGWPHNVVALCLFMLWLSIFFTSLYNGHTPSLSYNGHTNSLLYTDAFARYLLGIPSSLSTAAGFYLQAKRVREPQLSRDMIRSVKILASVFVFYAIFAGLIVSTENFFPADYLNTGWFYRLTDIPVQIFRAICGTYMMIYTIKLLVGFNRETEYLLFQAKEEAMRLAERERISRDLHDGVIQTIYSAELMIESCQYKLQQDSPLQDDLRKSMQTMDKAMNDLRGYIMGLTKEALFHKPVKLMIKEIGDDFSKNYPIAVAFRFEADPNLVLSSNRQEHIYHIVKELLNNVVQHAGANVVEIFIKEQKRQLLISVADNGSGISEECLQPGGCQGLGLKNMRERIALLRGEITFETPMRGGTLVTLVVPKEVKTGYGGSFAYS